MVLVDPPVEVDGQVFDTRAEEHIADPRQRQSRVIARCVGIDAVGGELGEAVVEFRRDVVAVGVVIGKELRSLGVLLG